jgi:hypothetical protein
MRRLLVLIAGIGMLQAASGCKQIAGVCDCAPPLQPCCIYGLYPAEPGALPAGAAPTGVTVPPAAGTVPPAEAIPLPPKESSVRLPRDL